MLSAKIMTNMDISVVSFNPDVTKQAQELILPQKSKKLGQPTIYLNNASIANTNC